MSDALKIGAAAVEFSRVATIKFNELDDDLTSIRARLDALEAKGAAADPPADNGDGWIKWSGGECPVAPAVLVEPRFRRPSLGICPPKLARNWYWKHDDDDTDIVAYRIVQPAEPVREVGWYPMTTRGFSPPFDRPFVAWWDGAKWLWAPCDAPYPAEPVWIGPRLEIQGEK